MLPAGAWRAHVQVQDENGYLYRNGAWEPYDAEATYPEDEVVLNLEAGKTVELSDKGLEALDAPALADAA